MPITISENGQVVRIVQDVFATSGEEYEVSEEISETTAKCALVAMTEGMIFGPSTKEIARPSFHLLDKLFYKYSRGLEDMDLLEVKFGDPEIILDSLDKDELEQSLSRVFPDKGSNVLFDPLWELSIQIV